MPTQMANEANASMWNTFLLSKRVIPVLLGFVWATEMALFSLHQLCLFTFQSYFSLSPANLLITEICEIKLINLAYSPLLDLNGKVHRFKSHIIYSLNQIKLNYITGWKHCSVDLKIEWYPLMLNYE